MKRNIFVVCCLILSFLGCKSPEAKTEIAVEELTIGDIHGNYEQGNYTSQELVAVYLKRIERFNTKTNAITIVNPNALAIAKELDAEYERTNVLRPLHGIPIIIKDNINTVGMPTTAGAFALKDYFPTEDAFVIKKLVQAGAIIIGKSNMAEWAFSPMHTESSTGGVTRNPYNPDYVPAGSSGGTAASVAANLAVGGLGTDTGNSIRGPSSHCSLVGFRTTLGLISREGIVPLYLRNDVVGPMCRTVADATRMMEVMVGMDPKDPITENSLGKTKGSYSGFLIKNGLEGARIGVLRELSESGIDPEIKELFKKAIADLDTLGAEIIDPGNIPGFSELRQDQWCATFKEDLESFLAAYVKRDTIKTLEDVVRIGSTSEFSKKRLKAHVESSGKKSEGKPCLDAYHDDRRIAFREAIEKVMDSLELDALVYPSWNFKPARIENYDTEYKGDNNQVIAPHTGQPAFTVPMGFSKGDLPAGLQFLGRMYSEATLVKLAYAYEQGTKNRKPPRMDP